MDRGELSLSRANIAIETAEVFPPPLAPPTGKETAETALQSSNPIGQPIIKIDHKW